MKFLFSCATQSFFPPFPRHPVLWLKIACLVISITTATNLISRMSSTAEAKENSLIHLLEQDLKKSLFIADEINNTVLSHSSG